MIDVGLPEKLGMSAMRNEYVSGILKIYSTKYSFLNRPQQDSLRTHLFPARISPPKINGGFRWVKERARETGCSRRQQAGPWLRFFWSRVDGWGRHSVLDVVSVHWQQNTFFPCPFEILKTLKMAWFQDVKLRDKPHDQNVPSIDRLALFTTVCLGCSVAFSDFSFPPETQVSNRHSQFQRSFHFVLKLKAVCPTRIMWPEVYKVTLSLVIIAWFSHRCKLIRGGGGVFLCKAFCGRASY